MRSVSGVITAVQEGRFQLVADNGRVLQLMLAHNAKAEPQDLPALLQAEVRVAYRDSDHLIAGIVERIEIEDQP